MAARKLQNEIDKTLKKVAEGVEAFDAIYDKMMSTTHQAQKEKRRSTPLLCVVGSRPAPCLPRMARATEKARASRSNTLLTFRAV